MGGEGLAAFDPVASLLGDLDTITALAGSSARADSGGLVPGETRPAAMLLVDIVGFTPLAQVLGAEALSTLVDRCFRIFELTVQAHGGYCDKLIGDAGLYVFAGHVSYEPPCQGALRSAMEIQRRVKQVNESLSGHALSLRCGVSFGEVTRQRIGGDQQQFTVMGSAVNLVQRLEGAAVPGTVCTVREVLDETGTLFDFQPLGERELKGFGRRELFTVTGERAMPVQLRGRGEISPLVGRDELLAEAEGVVEQWLKAEGQRPKSKDSSQSADQRMAEKQPRELSSRLRQAERSAAELGRLLVLRGPTAVGKSRLAWELSKRIAAKHDVALATAHCTPHGGLLGFAAELCKVAGLTADNVAERWAELITRTEGLGSHPHPEIADGRGQGTAPSEDLMQHLPLLAYVLGSSAVDTAAIRQGDSAAFAAACKGALAACIELAAREGSWPLLVVEDVQWLGELGDVLSHLLSEVQLSVPLVVLATARVAADDAMLAVLVGDEAPRLKIIEVTALTPQQGHVLLSQLLPGAELPEALEAELHDKSLGLPYYYEEAARLLLRRGVVAAGRADILVGHEGEADRSVSPIYEYVGGLDSVPIPDDLRTLILGRLDALPAQLRELAQQASVLGRSFALDDLQALSARVGATDCGELCAALGALQQERIFYHDVPESVADDNDAQQPAGPRYFFAHILTQEAAYTSLLSVNRRRLHSAAGDIAAAQHVPGTAAEWDLLPQLYEHYAKAERWEDACRVACDTLILRARSHRLDLSEEWRERAEKSLEASPGTSQLQARVSWAKGVEALIRKELEPARSLLETGLLQSAKNNAQLRVSIIIDLALVLRELRDYAMAEGLLNDALDTCTGEGLQTLREQVLDSLGAIYRRQGKLKESISALEEALLTVRQSSNYNQLCTLLIRLGNDYLDCNAYQQALDIFSEAEPLIKMQSNPTLEVMLISNLGVGYLLLGNLNRALPLLEDALSRSRANAWREGEAYNNLNLGHLYLESANPAPGELHLNQAISLFKLMKDDDSQALAHGTLAEILLRMDRLPEAKEQLLEAEFCLKVSSDQFRRGLLQCTWARYHLATDNLGEAEIALSRASALNRHASTGSDSLLANQIEKLESALQLRALSST